MSRILIDQEGMRGAANELRAIDSELDSLRGRLRGAALGAMPPVVIAQIGATAGRADVVLRGHGERLRIEAGRLEWRAAMAEVAGGSDPALRGSFDFLDRSGLLGLASFVGIVPNLGRLRAANEALGGTSGRVGQVSSLYLRADEFRQLLVASGKHGLARRVSDYGRSWWRPAAGGARKANRISGRLGKVTSFVAVGFTARDVFNERTGRGQHVAHAGAAAVVVAGARAAGTYAGQAVGSTVGMAAGALVGSAFGPVGTVVGGAVGRFAGGIAGGAIGGMIGQQVGEWGVAGAEEALGSAFRSAEGLAEDAGRVAGDVADRAGDAIQDVGNAVKDKLKFW